MELVDGVPVLDYCTRRSLSVPARIELARKACLAIHHAHQQGIIHRDIKPSNVLVSEIDGDPIPKVIDFGIAKATSSEFSPTTPLTQRRQLVGTPAYMSPEQVEMGSGDVDTRSDIYSLGALLYEMLTGTTPLDAETIRDTPLDEFARMVREVEPPKPSLRVGSRHPQLRTTLERDLDWIVMKCLEKERERRYQSAHELADDLRRYLADEPVLAGPPDLGYRWRKFYRRNRTMVALSGFLALAVILGAFWTAWKNHELDQRNVELRGEKQAVQDALDEVERLSDTHVLDDLQKACAGRSVAGRTGEGPRAGGLARGGHTNSCRALPDTANRCPRCGPARVRRRPRSTSR